MTKDTEIGVHNIVSTERCLTLYRNLPELCSNLLSTPASGRTLGDECEVMYP